jgi:nucleotide-binding universal stress UspA family protein
MVVGPKAAERGTWIDARILEPFRTLLVPLDGSEVAESALSVASSFAESYGAQIHLVRVVAVPAAADGMGEITYMPDLLDTLIDSAKAYLRNTAEKLKKAEVRTDVQVGGAAWQLQDYVAANNIDLVIMTSHGRSGFIRSALGSVTDRLLGSAAPVLVVRPRE